MDLKRFEKKPLMGILRGIGEDAVEPLIEAIISSGLETVEIAMNTPDAAQLIAKAVKVSRGRLMFGAGTVMNKGLLRAALDAGATFAVTPVLVREVADECVKKKITLFPGAFTPREIYEAWDAGAAMVKLFPAKFFGPSYIKEVKAPFDNIKILACGGINPDTIAEYFKNGADAVAFGESVFCKERIAKKDFGTIKDNIEKLLAKIEKVAQNI